MGISIKEPCSEDWLKMTGTEKGAFCQKCAKEVIDFTDKTPIQIKSILAGQIAHSKNTCGRITNIQLDLINDDFANWKSDQESFRAVWMVSLVAIFGLTLFSCQNTLSKEIVSQINENGEQMLAEDSVSMASLESDSKVNESPKLDSDSLNNSESEELDDLKLLRVEILPWDFNEITMGGFGGEITQICEVTLGVVVTSGDFYIPEPIQKQILFEPEFRFDKASKSYIEAPITIVPRFPDKEPIITPRITGITNEDDPNFRAVIRPNPIQVPSKLYLTLHELSEININIYSVGNTKVLRSGKTTLPEGKHEVDLKLYKFDQGDYEMQIIANKTKRILNFSVI